MKTPELLYRLALTRLPRLGSLTIRQLLSVAGSATAVFERRNELPGLSPQLSHILGSNGEWDAALRLAEAEIAFAEKHHIQCLTADDEAYPSRLRECDDAPTVLFYRGKADLNKLHVISMVGTRHATDYGKSTCEHFVKELQELLPDLLVVSGLAYGIDIQAHRSALQYGLETVGVLAHGLDRIYPPSHKRTAADMTERGGLVTEFMSGTRPDKPNFVRRNRIVAGLSDATIVVESASKGGSLITAEIAGSYHRDCFAFPGRIGDTFSEGCNNLIRTNRAMLLQDAGELVKAMNWDKAQETPKHIQCQLFPDLNDEEKKIMALLARTPEGVQINTLVVESNIAINRMTGILFELEMKGIVRCQAGGMYRLV